MMVTEAVKVAVACAIPSVEKERIIKLNISSRRFIFFKPVLCYRLLKDKKLILIFDEKYFLIDEIHDSKKKVGKLESKKYEVRSTKLEVRIRINSDLYLRESARSAGKISVSY